MNRLLMMLDTTFISTHYVDTVLIMCPLSKFDAELQSLHDVKDDILSRLETIMTTALVN